MKQKLKQINPKTVDKIALWFFGVLFVANVGMALTDIAIDAMVCNEEIKQEKLNQERNQLSTRLYNLQINYSNMRYGFMYLSNKHPFEAPTKPGEEPTPAFHKVIQQMASERATSEQELGAARDSVKKLNWQRKLYLEKTVELKKVYLSSKNK